MGRCPFLAAQVPPGGLMLLLDAEAISAVAHGTAARRDRVRALIAEMRRRQLPVGTVAAVLAEVVRGHPRDTAMFSGLRRERVEVHPVDARAGVRADQILGSAGAGSGRAVDAFVVAVADLLGKALVATVDPADMELLASYATGVTVADIRA